MAVEPQYIYLVIYDGTHTKSLSRVFSKWSRSKSIGQYQCNFDFILDHRRHTLSYLTLMCACKHNYHELVTTLFRYTTL